jgi:hypothetical protein
MGKWIIQALRHRVKDERIHSTHFIHTIDFQVRYPTSISKELPTKNYRKKAQPSHNNQAHNDSHGEIGFTKKILNHCDTPCPVKRVNYLFVTY